MTEREFKDAYIVSFLASYNASIYIECCTTGNHDRLTNPPIEDAAFLADEAWTAYNKLR